VKVTALNIDALRSEQFPITQSCTYLNHASYGPLPRANVQAAAAFIHDMSETKLNLPDYWGEETDAVRAKAARLINCQADDIALLKNTTEGLCLVAQGIDWQPGDQVITYELEFPSDVYPWISLADRGVELRFVKDRGYRFDVEEVMSLINRRTRAICLSLVNFAHGFRAPLGELGAVCQQCGIWLVVDAIQAMGALRVDAKAIGADILCAHGYKFLLSGFGVAICYCSPRARSELRVTQPGWKSIERASDIVNMLNYNLDFPSSARKFESGMQNLPGVLGLGATLDLIQSVGIGVIEERVLSIGRALAAGLATKGFEVVSSMVPGERSGILSVRREGFDAGALQATLADRRVACAVREGRIRISPHFYNNSEDVEAFVACLPTSGKQMPRSR
jgi:cysteine desulfurase/selenocysteine lyase